MILALNLSYFRSTPSLSQPSPASTPGPLRIFKRPDRKASFNTKAPLAALASPLPESSNVSEDNITPRPLDYSSSSSLPYYSCSSAISRPPSKNHSGPFKDTIPSNCSLCLNPLPSPLLTYTFPRTAPAITARVHRLFPAVEPSPAFCGTCFEAIHAVHICWGCGNPIHRPEERVGCGWAWWHWGCLKCLICRAPLPPPTWTNAPITLSHPPSCKACTREIQHLAYTSRTKAASHSRNLRHRTSSQQLLHPSGGSYTSIANLACDGSTSRKASLGLRNEKRKVSLGLGMKYPPLPKWMEKKARLGQRFVSPVHPVANSPLQTHDGAQELPESEAVIAERKHDRPLPKWMAKLPSNRKGFRRVSKRVVSWEKRQKAGRAAEEDGSYVSPYGYERMVGSGRGMVGSFGRDNVARYGGDAMVGDDSGYGTGNGESSSSNSAVVGSSNSSIACSSAVSERGFLGGRLVVG